MTTAEKELRLLKQNYIRRETDCYEVMAKILKRMKGGKKHWWFAYEFADFGYKAPARLSDLVNIKLVHTQKFKSRLKVYRLNVEKLPDWVKQY